jgi:hypothetical protein
MNTRIIRNRLVSTSLTLVAVIGLMLAGSSTASAQSRNPQYRGNDNYWRGPVRRNEIVRIAQQNGYRDGFNHGRIDRSRRQGYHFADSIQYRSALSGYRWSFGDRDFYRQVYRDAYRRGYQEAFRRGGFGGRWRF